MEATERSNATGGTVALVVAAQDGDRRALDELVTAHLPLVYTIVGRALNGHADVDDVVQETMLRAVRDLPGLRAPASFRAWLTTIAVRRVGEHRDRRRSNSERIVVLDDEPQMPDTEAAFEDVTILRLDVAGQRREVAEASRWLDPGDRLLLSLWWQESAGRIERAEIAAALGLSVAHTSVRMQRMRQQLDLARGVVVAMTADPGCRELAAVTARWDGRPGSVWRKRLARHIRSCQACGGTSRDRIPVERLLLGSSLLAVPSRVAAAVAVKTAVVQSAAASGTLAGVASVPGKGLPVLAKLLGGHYVAVAVTGAAVTAAVAVAVVHQGGHREQARAPITTPAPPAAASPSRAEVAPSPTPSASPRSAPTLAPGRRLSLESVRGGYLFAAAGTGVSAADEAGLTDVRSDSSAETRRRATFVAVAGLADKTCYSFRTLDGRYLRHWELHTYTHPWESTAIFQQDATFCPHRGPVTGSVMLEAHNYQNQFLSWTGGHLLLRYDVGTASRLRDSSFRIRDPWAS